MTPRTATAAVEATLKEPAHNSAAPLVALAGSDSPEGAGVANVFPMVSSVASSIPVESCPIETVGAGVVIVVASGGRVMEGAEGAGVVEVASEETGVAEVASDEAGVGWTAGTGVWAITEVGAAGEGVVVLADATGAGVVATVDESDWFGGGIGRSMSMVGMGVGWRGVAP